MLEDQFLWPSFINIVYQYYFPKKSDREEILASPVLLTEEYVGGTKGDKRFPLKWPKTYIQTGTHDTLRDE